MKLTRREVVAAIGVGAVTVSTGALAAAPSTVSTPVETLVDPSRHANPFPGLERGAKLVGVWTVDAVHVPHQGAVAVHLSDGDHLFRLNVLKRDPAGVPGIGESKSLSVYVCNNGGGQRPTAEREGQAARALAAWLDSYEAHGGRLPELSTLRDHARPGEDSSQI